MVALIGALVGLVLGVFLGAVSVLAIPEFTTPAIPWGSMGVFLIVAAISRRSRTSSPGAYRPVRQGRGDPRVGSDPHPPPRSGTLASNSVPATSQRAE